MKYDVDRARQAVQYLVDSSYFHHHLKKLRSTVEKPRALPFREDAEPLNELLIVGRQNLKAMENLISVAEAKRDDRNAYQRHFMAAKRQRDRKVIQFEELMAGQRFSLDERNKALLRQYDIWNAEKEKFVAKLPGLSWAERNERIRVFWAAKEAEVDALIEEAKKSGPVRRKRVYTVRPEPTGAVGKALKEALQKPKKPVDRRR